jgi:hypothetical protein
VPNDACEHGSREFPTRRTEDAAGDADLLRRIRVGDRGAIDDLYERFRRPAFALARRILADDTLAEDVLQPGRATVAPLDRNGRAVATVVARGDRVQVVTHGLSVNDAATTTYVVWGLGHEHPVALGTFDVERPQIGVRTVGSGQTGLDGFAQYGISLEPGRHAPSEPTEVVAIGQVTS